MSSLPSERPCFALVSFGVLASACFLAGCSVTHIVITAVPPTAEVVVTESITVTAIVTGSSNPEDKEVVWSVCDGQGENCVDGGNSTVGTVVPTSADSDGNALAIYRPFLVALAAGLPGDQRRLRGGSEGAARTPRRRLLQHHYAE